MSLRDDAWALWASLGNRSDDEFNNLSFLVRSNLPLRVRNLIKAAVPTNLGRIGARKELEYISNKLSEADGDAALAVWLTVAKAQLGSHFSDRLDERMKALSEPGRDPDARGGGAEMAKVEVRDDLVSVDWLVRGQGAAAAVAFISVPRIFAGEHHDEAVGTGFVVTNDRQHIMTAFHVVEARAPKEAQAIESDLKAQLAELTISFNFHKDGDRGQQTKSATLIAWDRDLDYALLRLPAPVAAEPLPLFTGTLPKYDGGLAFVANIIQHPMRDNVPQPKQLGLRNNAVWKSDDQKLYYFTDTRAGSSGSPVMSDGWQVYAVHTGYDTVNPISYVGRSFAFANRGTLMKKVVPHAQAKLPAGVVLCVA